MKIRKKDDFASILTAWFYFVFAKKIDTLVRKYVYFMYQVSNISKSLTLISFRTDNFKLWKQCTLKPGHQRGLTGKTCNDGSGVNASTLELSDVDGVGHVFLLVCGLKDKYVIKSVILDTSWGYVTLNTTKHQSL